MLRLPPPFPLVAPDKEVWRLHRAGWGEAGLVSVSELPELVDGFASDQREVVPYLRLNAEEPLDVQHQLVLALGGADRAEQRLQPLTRVGSQRYLFRLRHLRPSRRQFSNLAHSRPAGERFSHRDRARAEALRRDGGRCSGRGAVESRSVKAIIPTLSEHFLVGQRRPFGVDRPSTRSGLVHRAWLAVVLEVDD